MKKIFTELVSKFETENKNVNLDHVIVEFSKFIQNEGVEPCKHQQMRNNYRQLLCRRITEKVNKTNEMTNSEGYLLKDYLCTLIHSTGRNYITVPVEEINDNTIQDVIAEAVDQITSDEIDKGNVPKFFLTYAPEAEAILSHPFYSIIEEMKEEQGIEENDDLVEQFNVINAKDSIDQTDKVKIIDIANAMRERNLQAIADNNFEEGLDFYNFIQEENEEVQNFVNAYSELLSMQRLIVTSFLTYQTDELKQMIIPTKATKYILESQDLTLAEKLLICYYLL